MTKNKNIKTSNLTIYKCMEQVNMVDYYITKNIVKIISNKKNLEFIKNNIFLLAINNKNNKNSIIILLEFGKYKEIEELIEYDYNILNFKNVYENNTFKLLLTYDYFYNLILSKIKNLDRSFVIKIITHENKDKHNFIDNLIKLLNLNEHFYYSNDDNKKILQILIDIAHNIYLLDIEKNTLLVTKLCKSIVNQKYLIDILKEFNINNFDIYPDSNLLLCIDYLILDGYFDTIIYLLDKINYIEFTNIDDNLIFKLCENKNVDIETKSYIIIKILYKSNITKFKNNKNQNIFYWLITEYNIDIKIIINFIDYINIYEQDIYGKTLFDLIKSKYTKKNVNIIQKHFSNQLVNKNIFEKIYTKINIKNKLIKSDIGLFRANMMHSMLYIIYILNSYKNIIKIPYYVLSSSQITKCKEQLELSNNVKQITDFNKMYLMFYTNYCPCLIIWKNKYNYWIDPNLIDNILMNKSTNFIYVKLSVYFSTDDLSSLHANVIIIDNVNKIVERFEPYGEMVFTNSFDINNMIKSHIAIPLGYEFKFVQPYPGFQSRSDEYGKFNKNYGDPMGFCLAWSFLYIDIKLELFKKKINTSPIDFINWYIINKFDVDFDIDYNVNKTNKYILFIRFYAKYLDSKKNEIIEKFGLDSSLSYQNDFDSKYENKLIFNINKELDLIHNI